MKKIVTLFCIFIIQNIFSQNNINNNKEYSFYDIQRDFDLLWQGKTPSLVESNNIKDGGYEHFKRWEYFMHARAYPLGKIPDPDILVNEYIRTKSTRQSSQYRANWNFVGPSAVPYSYNKISGAGRINCITVHPSNSNILYVGAACGGIWKSIDGGATWNTTSDLLASISIADIVIDPSNPNIVYAATGDGYASVVFGGDFFGGTYSAGVVKSTDGGATWASSGLTYSQAQTTQIFKLLINPLTPSNLIAATSVGVYYTSNSGTSWIKVLNGKFYDIEFNSQDPNFVYAVNDNQVYRSSNGGANFSPYSNIFSTNSNGRVSIAVTSDTNYVYAYAASNNLYLSTDGGLYFSPVGIQPPITLYGVYDCVLEVAPNNSQYVMVGGVDAVYSNTGGNSWNGLGAAKVHPDVHEILFLNSSGSSYYFCCDGGLYKTTDGGISFTDLSNNLQIKQYYRISSSTKNFNKIYGGSQDNGTDQLISGNAKHIFWADGTECLVDYNDEKTVYVSTQNGYLQRSKDETKSFNQLTSFGGAWVNPLAQNPLNPYSIYIAQSAIRKSVNQGDNWFTISSGTNFNFPIERIVVSNIDTNTIYASNYRKIYKTINGTTWTEITAGLPAKAEISYIAFSSFNAQHVWVTLSGYTSGSKVFKSVNGGGSWTNVSGTLPNIPVNCIVYQHNTNDELYIGTDFGVYYRNANMSDWQAYQSGLPNVIINDIEINYSANKLFVATFGRGVWETTPVSSTIKLNDAGINAIVSNSNYYCNTLYTPIVELKNFGSNAINSVDIKYSIDGGSIQTYSWSGALAATQSTQVTLLSSNLLPGGHLLKVYTQNLNTTIDSNWFNDTKYLKFIVDTTVINHPLTEGFETANSVFPPVNWRIDGCKDVLIANVGGFSNSTKSLRINRQAPMGYTYLLSQPIDVNTPSSIMKLDFNVCYYQMQPKSADTMQVSVSTDCGQTWTNAFKKGGATLQTAPDNTNNPNASHWRAESVDLSNYIGAGEMIVRFELPSTKGSLYLDDINLYANNSTQVTNVLQQTNITVAPVPFTNFISVNSEKEGVEFYNLFDISGRLILQDKLNKQTNFTINTSEINSGIYFLHIITAQGKAIKKIVKQ